MPYKTIQQNFANGELNPKMLGRSDVEMYYKSARKMRDVVTTPYGGFARRPHAGRQAGQILPDVRRLGVEFGPVLVELGAQDLVAGLPQVEPQVLTAVRCHVLTPFTEGGQGAFRCPSRGNFGERIL